MATTTATNKSVALVLACAAQFMVVLDVAIVNVALPSIAAFWVIFGMAALGALTAAFAFPRRTAREIEPAPAAPATPVFPKPAAEV